ncbi:hypothetical protein EF847_10845 [Actinobacteria bacterium YIM 96077]|uniref:Uncharacterized protein n=1 Tax=Phytoactinopolyspora halophila TaxID=1981511 RepID=A0A329QZC6_9ACTN|nr:hypothetical protein [Phytoactinopolyspora halophila]AYY13119.1 hypothetical protein EF847_10845 [Actinobacteria bacterium YIM 96077]RAW17641.1 hypothetical protein DPM12_06580 [Phytoactinopolyspora halophila]
MAGDEPIILDSARKHGVEDDDTLHALRHHVRALAMDENMTMVIGPARDAQLLEVGFVESAQGDMLVIHMPARDKFLKG